MGRLADCNYCRPHARPFRLGFLRKVPVLPVCSPATLRSRPSTLAAVNLARRQSGLHEGLYKAKTLWLLFLRGHNRLDSKNLSAISSMRGSSCTTPAPVVRRRGRLQVDPTGRHSTEERQNLRTPKLLAQNRRSLCVDPVHLSFAKSNPIVVTSPMDGSRSLLMGQISLSTTILKKNQPV